MTIAKRILKINKVFERVYYYENQQNKKKQNKILAQKQFYNNLKIELFKKLDNWKKFKPIRGKIEYFFKLLKQGLNMREIHKYTPKSVTKTVYLSVFFRSPNHITRILLKNCHYNKYLRTK